MSGPINIKGVTSNFSRHFGGGALDPKKRLLDSKGYSEAFKKAFKTNDLNKVKQRFKEAGIKTNRFSTSQKIKEKDFLKDIKLAAKAGIIKSPEMAKTEFRREQTEENRDLTFKEKRSFNILSKKTKQELIWGGKKRDLSFGAKMAAEQQKIRDQDIRKVGDVGIAGFETMEKQGDSTLWERYKALKALRYRSETARGKLKEISSEINLIRLKAKRDPEILSNYGIPAIQKDKSAWKPKTLPGREGARAQNDENDENKEKQEKQENNPSADGGESASKKFSSSQGSVNISHSAGSSAPAGVSEAPKREAPVAPFSIVKGLKVSVKEAEQLPDEANAQDAMLTEGREGNIEPKKLEDEQQYGFIDQDGGDVKLDTENQEMGVDK